MWISNSTVSRNTLVWLLLVGVLIVPITFAAMSPQLQWRGPVYIAAGFAGILALALLLLQPLLAAQKLPGISPYRSRRIHRWLGGGLTAAVVVHVAALWITSPPDVIDALLFRSPTWFAIWGVVAMWGVFAATCTVILRNRFRRRVWRQAHTAFAVVVVSGSISHAMLIEGTMEIVSKAVLCASVGMATLMAIAYLQCWVNAKRR
ncbi:ferric reductase-like transmembrane domain-containing protein [Yoonia sp. I 8.24]|uniref:ferric reductase-like transmembrane domain-containing protein n=1 Tax=Yoonia sp. I 8.24 TaxID=1537229 RepID=UPI001EE149D6|nr:ferric reductase-like transmembrane domain-containing protein [Yoonia sp. I 8.24]MCG3267240.1 ferric reductase-like transmembrane domain-containing protein [Yoonia sp. I 8.24]